MKNNDKLRLALLCGGISSERDVSLKGAKIVKGEFDPTRYEVILYDTAKDLERLVKDAPTLDVAFILLHGRYGEDGTVQGLLELLRIPYQGSGVLGSALAMDKHLSKVIYKEAGIHTPRWLTISKDVSFDSEEIIKKIGLPLMIKPATHGSSVGMKKAINKNELEDALEGAFKWDERVLLEEFIQGREITGGVLGLDNLTALPIVEICPGEKYEFFDYDAKYKEGATREICPAELLHETTKMAQEIALKAHRALQLRGYSRTDMILQENGEITVLETNTIPGMTPTSLFPQAAKAAGISFPELLDRLIEMALTSFSR